MAKYLDYTGLSAYDRLIKELIKNGNDSLVQKIEEVMGGSEVPSVAELQDELQSLQNRVLEQNNKNRALLRAHLTLIRQQMESFKNPYRNNRSVYATKVAEGRLVAVEV